MQENGLLYAEDHDGRKRLCIPQAVLPEILRLAHGDAGHPDFERTLKRLDGLIISRCSKNLRNYIKYCPQCILNKTRRHKPYGSLQPILTPPIPFHTITIDYILGLPESGQLDCCMSVTSKFTKRVTFIPGAAIWTAGQWAEALLERLRLGDWGIPRAIISDRDRKFLSELWRSLFREDVDLQVQTELHTYNSTLSLQGRKKW